MRRAAGTQPALTALTAVTSWLVLCSWARLLAEPDGLLPELLAGVAAIAVTGALLRLVSLAWPFVLSGQLLVAMLAVHTAWGTGLVPTSSSLRAALSAIMRAAETAETYRAPVPDSAPTMVPLLLVAGLAVHLVVDLLGVSLRWATLAGLPLLAAYVVPVSVLDEPTPWPLLVAAGAGFLAMLVSEERGRLQRWGRLLADPDRSRRPETPRGTLVVGGAALVLAVIVPALLPHAGITRLPGTGSPAPGSTVRVDDPIADLRRDLVLGADLPLLDITLPEATRAPSYVRMSVLDEFDGEAWKVGTRSRPAGQTASGPMPSDGLVADTPGVEVPWSVDVADRFASSWLPVPLHLRSIEAGEDWRYDLDAHDFRATGGHTTAGETYTLTEFRAEIDTARLVNAAPASAEIVERYTRVPTGTGWLRDIARKVTSGAESRHAQAVALQTFFQEEFRYDTRIAAGNGLPALRAFLDPERGRRGYCEQFAAAMALMARELGIPARVSVGFLSAKRLDGTTVEFSTHDLHAWPELYFPGSGWVMFEPTPVSHTRALPPYTREQVAPTASPSPSASTAAPSPTPRPARPDSAPTAGADDGTAGTLLWLAPLLVLVAAAAAGLLPRALRKRQRTRRLGTAVAEDAWAELRATAVDLGIAWPDGRSPRVIARSVGTALGQDGRTEALTALRRVVHAVETDRYAPAGAIVGDPENSLGDSPGDSGGLRSDIALVTGSLAASSTPRRRRRARWWPASTFERRRAGVTPRAADGQQEELGRAGELSGSVRD